MPVLDISRKSEHMLHVPHDQLLPSLLYSRPILAVARATTPLLCREEYSSLAWPPHILSTVHADGHLRDSPLLGIGKGAARNTVLPTSAEHLFSILLGTHVGVELLGPVVIAYLTF